MADIKDKDEGKISILMPVKNAAPFLNQTLQSIFDQTHKNWELICVDDHSEDESLNILQQKALTDNRVKVFPNQGAGILDALQKAEELAEGEMISRMDADDLLPPRRYELQYELLKKSGANTIVTGKVKYFSSSKALQEGFIKYARWLNRLSKLNRHYEEIYRECVIASPSWLMFKNDFKNIGGFSGLIYPEDYDFVFRLYKNNIKILSTNQLVLYWRDHPARASRNLPQYRDVSFFDLKWKRFLELDYDKNKPLLLYGAGPKGKKLSKIMLSGSIDFTWISGNKKKAGHSIYGKTIQDETIMREFNKPFQLIVAISSPTQLASAKNLIPSHADIYYFC